MVMKDKLYKSNHKGGYYRTRKLLIASAVILSGITCVSVPTYINIQNHNAVKAEKINVFTKDGSKNIVKGVKNDKYLYGNE